MCTGFKVNVSQVLLHGLGTDVQHFGYLFINMATCHQAQDLDLAGRDMLSGNRISS